MEQWVVDASVLVQAFVIDTDTPRVFSLLHMAVSEQAAELFVPEFCLLECTNVLWKRARFDGMPTDRVRQSAVHLISLPLVHHLTAALLPRALTLGIEQQLAVYDSPYIVLAETLQAPLITVDQRQQEAASARGIDLKPITDFLPIE
ncbi:MAG: type II toxin-antitoxin system VapC family toxin [Anaerolineae bacterium]|nr:type II toxin-antitoxin system VapC family toxin [Anaerolineae bacterium]